MPEIPNEYPEDDTIPVVIETSDDDYFRTENQKICGNKVLNYSSKRSSFLKMKSDITPFN